MAKYEYQSTMLWHDNDDVNACLQKDEEDGWEIMQMTALPVQVGDDLDYDEPHILLLMRRLRQEKSLDKLLGPLGMEVALQEALLETRMGNRLVFALLRNNIQTIEQALALNKHYALGFRLFGPACWASLQQALEPFRSRDRYDQMEYIGS